MSALTAVEVASEPLSQEFAEIFWEHHQMVYRTAYRVTGTQENAYDVLQTIALRLVKRLPPDFKRNPKAYLYRAAVNLSLNVIASRERWESIEDPEQLAAAIKPVEPQNNHELYPRLFEGIAQLKPKAAEILLLRYVHNYSDAKIVKLLGTSRGTIAVSLYRSKRRLKKIIRKSLEEGS